MDRDVGAASAMVIFAVMTIGAGSMGIISLFWTDKITVIGVLGAIVGIATLAFWLKYHHEFLPAAGRAA